MENADKVSMTNKAEVSGLETPAISTDDTPPKLIDNPEIIEDTPDESTGIDIVYDEAPKLSSEAKQLINGISRGLSEAGGGGDVIQGFTNGMLSEGNTIEESFPATLESNTRQLVLGLSNRVDPSEAGALIASRVKEATNDTLLGKYKTYIRSFPTSELLSDKEIEEAAYASYTQHKIAEVWDGMSTSKVVGDFVQMVLLPTDNYKMKELADYFGLPFDAGDMILKGDFVKQFATSLSEIPPENRAHIFQKVVDNWETIGGFDNKMELMAFLARLEGIDDMESAMLFVESATDVLSLASIPGAVAKGAKTAKQFAGVVNNIVQHASTLRRIASTKNVDVIADAALAGARGELKAAGVSPLDAATTMLPFDTTRTLTQGAPEGVAVDILKREQLFANVAEEARILDLPIDDVQQQAIIDKVIEALDKHDEITNIRLTNRNDKGFILEYDSFLGAQKQEVTFRPTDTGVWEDLTYLHGGIFASKNFKMPGVAKDLVQGPEAALHAGSRIKKEFDKVIRDGLKGMTGDNISRINNLLAWGEGKKTFSYGEVVGTGVNGVRYTPDEFKAYSTIRQAFDTLHLMKEREILTKWKLENVWRFDLNGSLFAGKVYDDSVGAMAGFSASKTHSNWYIAEGKLVQVDLTKDVIKDMYQKGYRLLKTDALSMHKAGSNAAEWVFKKQGELIDPSTRPVLNTIPGYVTRINENANFFLKKKTKVKIGGKDVTQEVTHAYFDKFSDLEEYRKTLPDADDWVVRADRELSTGAFDDDVVSSFGGLFTGKRSSQPLQYGPPGSGQVGKQVPVLSSLQRYIENVGRNMPLAIFREGLKQKWINTAVDKGVLTGYTGKESFAALESLLNPKHPNYFFFKNSYDEVKFISGVRSLDEMEWAARAMSAGKWFENSKIPFVKDMSSFFYNGRIRDIAGGLKSATYHALLGMWNPAQPFIQFSGVIIPLAANPLHGLKGLEGALELTILDYMAKYGNIKGMKTPIVDMNLWRLWDESGMGATVYGSVDYAGRLMSDMPYNAGIGRKILSTSDIGVKIGEAGYSRVAFSTAYNYVKDKLGRIPTTKADADMVLARAEQYKMNMSRANMAGFQKGSLTSFAGMFMQVQTKFVEKMLGRDFTLAEKSRLAAAQIALYGAAGAPIVGTLAPAIMSFFGVDNRSQDAETLAKLQKGALGWYFSDYLGTNAEISDRFSLGNNFLEAAMKMVVSPTMASPLEMMSGASWAVLSRGADALQKSWYVGKVILNADNVSDEMILGGARVIADEFGTIAASYRNLLKGMTMYRSQMYHNKDGLPVFRYRDPSFNAALAQALGFQNTEANNWYEIADGGMVFHKPQTSDNYAKVMASIMTKLINADVDRQDVYAAAYNTLLSAALTQKGGEDVLKKVVKYLETPGTTWNDQIMKGLKLYQAEYTGEGLEELIKQGNIRSNVVLGREMEKYGVEK